MQWFRSLLPFLLYGLAAGQGWADTTLNVKLPSQTITTSGVVVVVPSYTVQVKVPSKIVTSASSLVVIGLSAEPYKGNPHVKITIDGTVVDASKEVSALAANGGEQFFAYPVAAAPKQVLVAFLDDLYEGTAATDRNVNVLGVSVNNVPYKLSKSFLGSTNETATATPAATATASTGIVVAGKAPVVIVVPAPISAKVGTPYTTNPAATPGSAIDIKTLGVKADGVTDDTDAIQKAVNSQRSLLFSAGTYRITKPFTFLGDKTYFAQGAILKPDRVGMPVYLAGSNVSILGFTFQGGGLLAKQAVSGLTLMYNTWADHRGESGDWTENMAFAAVSGLTNSTVKYNTFRNRLPPASVDLDPARYKNDGSGSDPDRGGGIPPTCFWATALDNTVVSYNTFDHCFQAIKMPSTSGVQANVTIENNLAIGYHRMFIENQQIITNLVIRNNVAKLPYLAYWETYAISDPSPPSLGTIISGNYLQGGPFNAGNAGLGIEFGGQNGLVTENTMIGPWSTSMVAVYKGSKGVKVNKNRMCSNNTVAAFAFAGVGDEHKDAPATGTDYSGNDIRSGLGACPADMWAQYDLSR